MASFLDILENKPKKTGTFADVLGTQDKVEEAKNIKVGQFESDLIRPKVEIPSFTDQLRTGIDVINKPSNIATEFRDRLKASMTPKEVLEPVKSTLTTRTNRYEPVRQETDVKAKDYYPTGLIGDKLKEPLKRFLTDLGVSKSQKQLAEQTLGAASKVPGLISKDVQQGIREQQETGFTIPEVVPFVGGKEVGSFDVGRTGAELATMAAQYGVVNKALEGTKIGSTIVKALGGGARAKFLANQGVDLLADAVIQMPGEIIEGIQNDQSFDEIGKDILLNRAIDAGMNLVIGGLSKDGRNLIKEDAKKFVDYIKKRGGEAIQDSVVKAISKFNINEQNALKNVFDIKPTSEVVTVGKQLEPSTIKTIDTGEIKAVEQPKTFAETLQSKEMVDDVVKLEEQFPEAFDDVYITPKEYDSIKRQGESWAKNNPTKFEQLASEVGELSVNDIGTFNKWTRDVYRNLEKAFGETYPKVKKSILDPFDAAKKARVEDEIRLTDKLKKEVVDKFGFDKGSKQSKYIQRFGEGKITLENLKKEMPKDWQGIVEADKWFRKEYDELLTDVNSVLASMGKDPVPRRKDYYHHFREISSTWEGIKNTFKDNQLIAPELVGLSEYTKPTTKWAKFKQQRGLGEYKEDAIGGFLEYIPAATYAKHIDPHISKFRNLRNYMAKTATENSKGLQNTLEYLDEFSNTLAGKTGFVDRSIMKLIGRDKLSAINQINSRMKSNAVLGNASSSLAQIANVPQGIADVKDPRLIAEGLSNYFKSLVGGGDKALYDQSGFLKERFTDAFTQFDTKLLQQPKNFAKWMLGVGDEVGTKAIWSMEYQKALKEGVENPIKYADDITRKLVAGRGIGEMPELQRQKVFQLVAPFTLEVGNLWNVQKDFLKDKDFAALAILYASNYLLNDAIEGVRGSRVTFDPIDAVIQGMKESEGGTLGERALKVGGALGGEVLGNIPLGQSLGSVYPEYGGDVLGLELPTREQLFGENDPTRFGTQLPIARALQEPQYTLLPSWGGAQLKKTKQALDALNLFGEEALAKTKSDKLQTPINKDFESIAKGLLFGKSGIPEVKEFYESGRTPFGDKQTANFETLLATNKYDAKELYDAITEAKKFTKKDERIQVLSKYYKDDNLNNILKTFFNYSID